LNWAEGPTHGGDIDLTNEIISGLSQNIFDNVSNAERQTGDTEYRKIYVRNDGGFTWTAIQVWIQQQTPSAFDDIWITSQGSKLDVQSAAVAYGYYQPGDKTDPDALALGNLGPGQYHHIWIRRIVTAGGPVYAGNSFEISFESDY